MDTKRRRPVEEKRKLAERSEVNKEFCFAEYMFSTTGLQGPGKMWEAPYKLLKVLWLLAFLAAFGVMVIQLVELFKTFFSYPIKTSVTLGFSPLTLPALTLCNVNPIRLSRARDLPCQIQDVLKIDDQYKHPDCKSSPVTTGGLLGIVPLPLPCLICDVTEDQEGMDEYYQRRQQIATLLAQERRETRMMAGHQREDFIVNCSLFGRTCSFLNITPFLSKDYGNCYTIVNHDVKASQTGPATALDLTLNLESEEFVTSFKTGYGLRVVLHEEGTRAFPSSEGFTVSSGAETNIGVKLTQITRMGGQYGDCQQEHEHNETGYKYTIMNCRDQCLKKAMMEECQCVSPDDGVNTPNDTVQYCSTLQEFRCLKGVYEDYYNSTERGEDMCQCFNPCNELVYSPTLSSRPWPVLSFVETLEEQVCRDRGDSPKCAYTNQVFTVESADTRRASFARIRLYYERLNYEIVEESPFYNTERFLSDIGGTLGLWIGVTVLGLAELLELLLLCLLFCCKRFKTSNRLQP